MERIPFLIAHYPRHSVRVGKLVFLVGSVLVLAAIFGRAGLARVNDERATAQLPPLRRLVEAFPHHPTWLVPETVVGFGVAAFLIVAGMTLVVLGEKALRQSGRS